jgi:hypothetical protein
VSLAHWSCQVAWDHGQNREERGGGVEESTHHAPRRLSRRHGGAVPARPAGCYPRLTSPSTHREHHTTVLPPASSRATQAPEVAQQAQGRKLSEALDRRRMEATDLEGEHHPDLLGGEDSVISNWRRWKRRWRRSFCSSIGGEGRRSRPEWPGDGGGDPDRQRGDERERGARVRGWAGSVVRPRPEPGCLSRARWADLASRPVGPGG